MEDQPKKRPRNPPTPGADVPVEKEIKASAIDLEVHAAQAKIVESVYARVKADIKTIDAKFPKLEANMIKLRDKYAKAREKFANVDTTRPGNGNMAKIKAHDERMDTLFKEMTRSRIEYLASLDALKELNSIS